MPYPDNFSGSMFDRYHESPEDVLPSDAAAVYEARETYQEAVEACIDVLKKHGVTSFARNDINFLTLADGIADLIRETVTSEISNLEDAGFSLSVQGDDDKKFMDRMYSKLKGNSHA